MKANKDKWQEATALLRSRRVVQGHNDDNRYLVNDIRDYKTHLNKCGFGSSVLDVGCGSQFLRRCLPEGVQYVGIDAFPIKEFENDIVRLAIEDEESLVLSVDTVCCMAVLDNCLDFDKAIENVKQIAKKNVIILTGIDIEVDQYHTFNLQLDDFDSRFRDWDITHREELQPKVWLLCYGRK